MVRATYQLGQVSGVVPLDQQVGISWGRLFSSHYVAARFMAGNLSGCPLGIANFSLETMQQCTMMTLIYKRVTLYVSVTRSQIPNTIRPTKILIDKKKKNRKKYIFFNTVCLSVCLFVF